jgi:type II secretory pathway pseudopilin PulG
MKTFNSINSKRTQAGDFLIEAMMGVLLMGIVGAGVSFVTSRVSVSQHNMVMQEFVIGQLRSLIMAHGTGGSVCTTTPYIYLPNNEVLRVEVAGCNADASATVAGVTLNGIRPPLVLSVNSPSLGEIKVGGH